MAVTLKPEIGLGFSFRALAAEFSVSVWRCRFSSALYLGFAGLHRHLKSKTVAGFWYSSPCPFQHGT